MRPADHLPSKSQIFDWWKDRLRELASLSIGENPAVGRADTITAPGSISGVPMRGGMKFSDVGTVCLFSVVISLLVHSAAQMTQATSF